MAYLNVVIATRKTDFHVKYLSGAKVQMVDS